MQTSIILHTALHNDLFALYSHFALIFTSNARIITNSFPTRCQIRKDAKLRNPATMEVWEMFPKDKYIIIFEEEVVSGDILDYLNFQYLNANSVCERNKIDINFWL